MSASIEPAPSARDVARAAGLYLAMTALFLWPVFSGRLIAQTDTLFFMPPWTVLRPPALAQPGNAMLNDQTREFLSFFAVARESLAQGELPLWNPAIMAGMPLLADSQSALLYPLNFGHYILPLPWGFTVSAFLKIFLTALATYAFARRLGSSHAAALLAGTAYAFAAFNVFWLSHPHTNVTLLFPLTLLAVEEIVRRPDGRSAASLAVAVGLALLGGHVEIAFLVAVAAGLFLLLRIAQSRCAALPRLAAFAGGYFLGAGLGGVMIVPFVEFLTHSITWQARSASNPFVVDRIGIATLLVPDLFVLPGWGGGNLFHALSLYVGAGTILLALVAVLARPRGGLLALLALGAFGALVAFDVGPLFGWLTRLPVLKQTPTYYMVVYPILALALLGGAGLDVLLPVDPPAQSGVAARLALLLCAALAIAGAAALGLRDPDGALSHRFAALGATDPAAVVRQVGSAKWAGGAWLAAVAVCAGVLVLTGREAWRVALVGVIFADLWLAGSAWNPAVAPEAALPEPPPALRAVATPPGTSRVAGIGAVLPPNTGVYAGLEDIRGYDVPVLESFHRYFTELLGGRGEWWIYDLPSLEPAALPLFAAANVEWFLTQGEAPAPLELAYDGEVRVYRNPRAMPRAYVVPRAESFADGAAARARVRELGDRLRDVVVLEAPPSALAAGAAASGSDAAAQPQAAVRVASYAPRRVVLEASAAASAWLVLADSAYPGWRAAVDGVETPIYRANGLFRAVRLPVGAHRVEFVYKPWSARAGVGLSLASIGISLWLFARTRTRSSS